jgi:anti-sigma regulatory factor (Ser/Thr protein kinase)
VLDQRFDVDGLYQIRAAVGAHAAELGLSAELANDVVIAVHELASNSVRHGPGCGRLLIWASPKALTCEVADGAAALPADSPAPPEPAPTGTADLPWPVEAGHGLWLAGKVADRLTVQHDDQGSTVTIRFDLRR